MKMDVKCYFMVLAQIAVIASLGMQSPVFSGGPDPENNPTFADSTQLAEDNIETSVLVTCPEPRPQMCTMEYRPVCAQQADGRFKTYSNGCTSCSDPTVVGYRDGACEEEK
jgi:hypothetical protein